MRPGHGVAAGAVATMLDGAVPCSTQLTSVPKASNALVEGPELQCPMPGTRNSRTKSGAWTGP